MIPPSPTSATDAGSGMSVSCTAFTRLRLELLSGSERAKTVNVLSNFALLN